MGRPKMNLTPTVVRLPHGTIERIEAVVGRNRRAAFIREAVDRELRRRERETDESKAVRNSSTPR